MIDWANSRKYLIFDYTALTMTYSFSLSLSFSPPPLLRLITLFVRSIASSLSKCKRCWAESTHIILAVVSVIVAIVAIVVGIRWTLMERGTHKSVLVELLKIAYVREFNST